MVALSRVFEHTEAKSIVRWGIQECLDMTLTNSPLLLPENWKVRRNIILCQISLNFFFFFVCVVCFWSSSQSAECFTDLSLVNLKGAKYVDS